MATEKTFRVITINNRPHTEDSPMMPGIVGGVIAGIAFALAEMVINAMLGKPFPGPLRLISSMALGTEALDPGYRLTKAGAMGLVIHVILSGLYGAIFARLATLFNLHRAPAKYLIVSGSLFGLGLWVVSFLIIVPITFEQFTQVNQFWNGFVAHTFFYGTVLGWLVASLRLPKFVRTEDDAESFIGPDEQKRVA